MRKLDPLRLLPQRVLDMFGSDPMSLARVRIALVGILLPYLARVPGTVSHGATWLTSYLEPDLVFLVVFHGLNAIGWGGLVLLSYLVTNRAVLIAPAVLGFGFIGLAHAEATFDGPFDGLVVLFTPVYALLIFGVAFGMSVLLLGADRRVDERVKRPSLRHLDGAPDGTLTPVLGTGGRHLCFACGANVNYGASECRRCEQPFEYGVQRSG
jgi:hypothetical protein